ncbi:MAG: hypothetical protein M3R27_15715, partial [Bacteroidota bacterium]|nr:hypothetical protein [Bacteroidota bacterium]
PETSTALVDGGLRYHTSLKAENAKGLFDNFFGASRPGDYIALQAYVPENAQVEKSFHQVQTTLQRNLHLAVSTQFGPRYLHSTGQFHKGGPDNGYFIQFISNSAADVRIPEQTYTFGQLKKAQAMGDMEALRKQKRKVIMIDLGEDTVAGLLKFNQIIAGVHLHAKQPKISLNQKEHNPTAA